MDISRRRVLALVAALVLVATLTACTPDRHGQVAVRKVDDGVELVFATCANDPIIYVSLYEWDKSPGKQWLVTAEDGKDGVDTMRLFIVPGGWHVEQQSLERLDTGVKYGILATSKNVLMSELSTFTVEQIDGLADGDVIARKSGLKSQVVSIKDFQQAAIHDCP